MLDFPTISDRTLIDKVIAVTAPLAPWRLPLLRAARDGIIALVELARGVELRAKDLESIRRPTIVLVSDDDYMSSGPSGFPTAHHLATWWAKAGIIHAAGGEAHHYENAVLNTVLWRRLLLVETSSGQAQAWVDLIAPRRSPMLLIKSESGVHPVPLQRETVQ